MGVQRTVRVTADRDTAYVWAAAEAQPSTVSRGPSPRTTRRAPATSTVTLLNAARTAPVATELVQLLDKDGNNIPNNTFTFNGQTSPEEGISSLSRRGTRPRRRACGCA